MGLLPLPEMRSMDMTCDEAVIRKVLMRQRRQIAALTEGMDANTAWKYLADIGEALAALDRLTAAAEVARRPSLSEEERYEQAIAGLDVLLRERDEAQRRYAELLDEKFQEGCDECDARRLEAEDALAALLVERDEARQRGDDLLARFVRCSELRQEAVRQRDEAADALRRVVESGPVTPRDAHAIRKALVCLLSGEPYTESVDAAAVEALVVLDRLVAGARGPRRSGTRHGRRSATWLRIAWNFLRAKQHRAYPCRTCGYRYDCPDGECHS